MTSSHDPPRGGDPPAGAARMSDQVLSIIGFVCAVVAVLFTPVLFGLAGIVLGIAGHARGEPLGKWAAAAAGVGMVIGTALSFILESVMS
ncbi:hypothetical protein ACTMTI_19070 [Nonomuraea sp. H19]|uniref:hypothetical protein n=1 Tax=Nonomuraea sp. H19 TaxID=3452206 RepID=UPI003F8CAC09